MLMWLSDAQLKLLPKIQDKIIKILNNEHCLCVKGKPLFLDSDKCPKSDDGEILDCDYCKVQHILKIKGLAIVPKDFKIVYDNNE
jgi:septum formation inhibitor-activating ATPase MinD